MEIQFAYPSFNWSNNAKGGAGVTVVIIGVGVKNNSPKSLYLENNLKNSVKHINPYLAGAPTIYVNSKTKPINYLPEMVRGNYTGCCNALILTSEEKEKLIKNEPSSVKFIRPFVGSSEFIKNDFRYCLWISDNLLNEAKQIPEISERIDKVREERLKSTDKGQNNIANRSHQFREFNETTIQSVIVPVVSSQRRNYIPTGFISPGTIVPNSAQIIYDCETWVFGVVSSRIHMSWVSTVAGRLRGDYRYSSSICYNVFPFPEVNQKQKEQINLHVFEVLEEREKHSGKTLAQLYDPDKMPKGLKEAHHQLDLAIERCYRLKPFESDIERLEYLFKEYEKMINKNTLLEKPKRTRKKKA